MWCQYFIIALIPIIIIILAIIFGVTRELCKIHSNSFTQYRNVLKYIHKIPGPPSVNAFFGSAPRFCISPENLMIFLRELAKKYYPVYSGWTPGLASLAILSPEDFELILSNPKHTKKSKVYDLLHNWLGEGLLTSNGEKWVQRRKMLTPAFHFNVLRQFLGTFNNEAKTMVQDVYKECHKPSVEVDPIINKFTLTSIVETAMGTKLDFTSKNHMMYKQSLLDITKIYLYRLFKPYLIFNEINFFTPSRFQEKKYLRILHGFSRNIIKERQENFQPITLPSEDNESTYETKKKLAMLDLLLSVKAKQGTIDDEGIREEVDTFTFEGHDTTAVCLGFTLMLIACHQDVQEKIFNEIKQILGDNTEKPTYQQLQELRYMERCIKESLRLYPSVHFISRQLGEDLTLHSGYKLLKDTVVFLIIHDLHLNPRTWPEPEKFDPDRFLPENCQNRHPFAYVPFSAGPRNCIGQKFAMLELKAALCAILTNFKLEPIDTPSTIVLIADIVLRTKDPIRVKFVPRK